MLLLILTSIQQEGCHSIRQEHTDMFKAIITTTYTAGTEHMHEWHGFNQLYLSGNIDIGKDIRCVP